MPYRHVCDIITKREYYEPSMLHVRWHNLYNYYHSTKHEASNAKENIAVLRSLLKVTRDSSYNDSGQFKNIYVLGSRVHNNLPPYSTES